MHEGVGSVEDCRRMSTQRSQPAGAGAHQHRSRGASHAAMKAAGSTMLDATHSIPRWCYGDDLQGASNPGRNPVRHRIRHVAATWQLTPQHCQWIGFATAGVLAGLLQGIALRRSVRELKSAKSALQVRAALIASIPGKASVALLWAAVLTVAAMFAAIPTMLGFYAFFALGREVTAFPTLFALRAE